MIFYVYILAQEVITMAKFSSVPNAGSLKISEIISILDITILDST